MTDDSNGQARPLEDILEDVSAGRMTVPEAAESIRRQSPQTLQQPARKRTVGIAVAITMLGFVLLVLAGITGAMSYRYSANAVKTQGTVTEMVRRGRVSYPRYQYVADGVLYTTTSVFGTNPPSYKTGDTVEVEYLRDQPADSRLASWGDRWFVTLISSILGGVLTIVGGSLVLAFRRS